jgi:DNA-binding transcriptional MerR regulator
VIDVAVGASRTIKIVAEPVPEELTIDELARMTGATTRNIRAYQSRGLLSPPVIRARTGYYGSEHVQRLRIIQALQNEGFRLDAIRRLLEQPGSAAEQIVEFGRALLRSFGETAPEYATTEELASRFGGRVERSVLRKAERLGLIRSLGDERWEIRNPTLVSAGEQLVAMGVPISHAMAVAQKIDHHTRAIAKSYVRMFMDDVMVGENGAGHEAPEDWGRVNEALLRLRPLALEAIHAAFEQAMSELVEEQMKRFLSRK